MLRGVYAAASGMLADQKRLDVVANNLANASTAGFKRDTTVTRSFSEVLLQRTGDPGTTGSAPGVIGRTSFGAMTAFTATRLTTGPLKQTGSPLDVAISGDGFFAVQTPQGIRYTRQGSFRQTSDGRLVTASGHEVLVDGQPAQADGPLTIRETGEVKEGDRLIGSLSMATSRDLGALRKEGEGLWALAGPADAATLIVPGEASGKFELKVGYLEGSNVETVTEMVELMTIMRSFEANQRALQIQDDALGRAVTEVGRLS